jgi:hypothetical protein
MAGAAVAFVLIGTVPLHGHFSGTDAKTPRLGRTGFYYQKKIANKEKRP